jgi:hypothetical protein
LREGDAKGRIQVALQVLEKLGWQLPPQPPPRICRAQVPTPPKAPETTPKM